MAGALSAAAMWWWLASSTPQPVEPASVPVAAAPAPASVAEPPVVAQPPVPLEPAHFDRRWLPAATIAVASANMEQLQQHAGAQALLHRIAPLWAPTVAPLYVALQLKGDQVRRLTWASTALGQGRPIADAASLVIIELARPRDDEKKWLASFEQLPERAAGMPVYRSRDPAWVHPLVVPDGHTIITGPLALLEQLGGPNGVTAPWSHAALDRLVNALDAGAALLVAFDAGVVRGADAAEIVIPNEWWGVRRNDWLVVRDLPSAAGLAVKLDARLETRALLECETESEAQQVLAASEAIFAGLEQSMQAERAALVKNLLSIPLATATADQIDLLLDAGTKALGSRSCAADANRVTLSLHVDGDLATLASAAITSVPALERTRLAAARRGDEQNGERLMRALEGHRLQERSFPAGAAGSALLPADTRLSWFATLLPYYGRFDWHRQLKFGRPWNDAENQPITRQPLEYLVNPALGPGVTPAGYSVTHYVGVAGLGADAATLDAGDSRAGVFGYQRRATLDQIADGASNTIAIAGVSGQLGPWASGGAATVRAFTTRPYIDGPDGFGSGQPQGLLVGMADGSVRWISKDVDPQVLEALVTIHGGETIDTATKRRLGWVPDAPEPVTPKPAGPAPLAAAAPVEPAEPVKPVEPEKPAPRVDLAPRLAEKLPAIEFAQVPLEQFVDLMSQMSTVPMTLDLEGMLEAGVHPDDRVSVKLTNSSIGEALETALAQRGLVYLVHDNQLLVTSPRRQQRTIETARYDVADLLARETQNDPRGGLVALITQFVEPGAWTPAGGPGDAKLEGTTVVVRQSGPVQGQVFTLLEKLRAARGLKPKTAGGEARIDLATRTLRARAKLDAVVTANFHEPTPLARILDYLQTAADVRLPLDGTALVAAGRTAQTEATLVADRRTLAEALDALLDPLGLGYRAVDARTIQITSHRALRHRYELEFYPAGGLVSDEQTPAVLVERIQSQVAPTTWIDAGGAAAIHFDPVSKYLLVWQTQPAQRQVEALLELRK
ncbi:MAG TPA: DUF1559 domain-containing protein [Pirellulales bacterium]|jgi:hypothetical protein|nr:DUF1559 domain-containing protein [Pirellulales bacterium]